MAGAPEHKSVLLDETVGFLEVGSGEFVIDATLGLGGHSELVLETFEDARVIGIDQDRQALDEAANRLRRFGRRFEAVHANFALIRQIARERQISSVAGIIADLGVSSLQLDDPSRGFSFRSEAELDMRMDRSSGETAAEMLGRLDEAEIADLIYRYGEERRSRIIARRIVERRKSGRPVRTTRDLAELVEKAIGRPPNSKIHPATRTFQALRIAVNNELGILEGFIKDSVDLLQPNGTLCVISFHSMEDRIVKQTFQKLSGRCSCPPRVPRCVCGARALVEILTKKPVVPTASEMDANPRSRSAKLRACRRLDDQLDELMEKQMKSNIPSYTHIKRNPRPRNKNLQYYATATLCCAVIVAGFFLAAKQHFSSMEYGMQNSRLRRQLDELQSEKRKLLVSREVSMSPVELRKAVRRIGFMDTPSTQLEPVSSTGRSVRNAVMSAVEARAPAAEKPAGKVVKTVINAPTVRTPILDKQAKRETTSGKRDRT